MGRYKQRTSRRHASSRPYDKPSNRKCAVNKTARPMPMRKQSHKGQKLNTWCNVNMQGAVEEWRCQQVGPGGDKQMQSIRTIARAWQVPYETLRRRIYGKVAGYGSASGRPTVLSEADENELVLTIKNMSAAGFPMTRKDVQGIAYTFATKHGLKGFSEKKLSAGYYWFEGFLNRHPDVNVKKAENLSVARAMGMNQPQVYSWFDSYEELLSCLGIQFMPRNIWNLDETGVQNIHKAESVVAPVGLPSYNLTAVEKGETSTVVAIMNAYGDIPAPMVIHRGKSIGKGWKDGAPFGTLVKASDSGWINKDLFVEFGVHFVSFLKNEGLDNGLPHVLLMDNHYAHIFNLEFLELMKQNNIHVFALPSHTTHWLQPLDRVPFGTLKRTWNEEMRIYTRNSAGVKLEKKTFFKIFSPVWAKSMTVDLAQAGFRATGLFPVNRRVIPDDAFAPSTVTDRCMPDQQSTETGGLPPSNTDSGQVPLTDTLPSTVQLLVVDDQLPVSSGLSSHTNEAVVSVTVLPEMPMVLSVDELTSTSTTGDQLPMSTSTSSDADQSSPSVMQLVVGESQDNVEKAQSDVEESSSSLFPSSVAIADQLPISTGTASDADQSLKNGAVTFASLMPVPHRERSKSKPRKKPPSYEITSDVCMTFVSERMTKKSTKPKQDSVRGKSKKQTQNGKAKKSGTQKESVKRRNSKSEDVVPCGVCGIRCCDDKYNRDWIRCQVCMTWYHNECQGIAEKSRLRTFVCVSCEDSD